MRVAQLACAGSYGGAEAVCFSLARALKGHAQSSSIYLVLETRAGRQACAALRRRAESFGVQLRVFETDSRFSLELLGALRRQLAADRIDVAHSHSYKMATMVGLLRRLPAVLPKVAVFTVHGFDQQSPKGRAFLHSVNAVSVALADQVIAVSPQLAGYYQRFPGVGRRLTTLANATAQPIGWSERVASRPIAREGLAARYGLDPEKVWFGLVGRLVAVKNQALAIDAFAALGERRRDAQLLIAGAGPLADALRDRIVAQDLEGRVALLGQVEQIDELYAALDALVLCSDSEGSPMVVLEAMAAGLAVVSTRVGGVEQIIVDESSGLLIDAGDDRALSAALGRLFQGELRDRLGQRAIARVSSAFSADEWARQHLAIYQRSLR